MKLKLNIMKTYDENTATSIELTIKILTWNSRELLSFKTVKETAVKASTW